MTPQRWAQIEELFNRAVESEPDEHLQLLREIRSTDPELYLEVESLLSSRRSANLHLRAAVLEEAAIRFADFGTSVLATAADSRESVGSRGHIGPYSLTDLIGQGGMGDVWLAEQEHPVRRRVALKLIRTGMDTREIVARFESERQTLALMDHPAIARVFDAGTTLEGRPYFAMEYVAGIPITDFCDSHKLTLHQRLQVFVLVCEGVQHAHQKAIIHRDLKPSNILVAEVDGKPLPRIIDFGVAKAISQKTAEATMCTQVGAVIGTFGYMSPEQALSSGEDIDTRTDVYSLGIVLYELLAGTPPLNLRNLPLPELLMRLREEDAPPPSSKLRMSGPRFSKIAQNRGIEPAILIRRLRGDLDVITLKAVERDKTRRYASVAELAADIRRYLDDETVLARTPSAAYQLRKFARRHRPLVGGALSVFVALTAGIVASSWEAHRARQAEKSAIEERNRADAVNAFLQHDLLAQAGPEAQSWSAITPDPDLKVRTALDRAARTVGSRFRGQPLTETAVRKTIGAAYEDLGLYAEAENELRRALELQRSILGDGHVETLSTMRDLAENLFRREGRYKQAEPLLVGAVTGFRRLLGEDNRETLLAVAILADLYRSTGRLKMAEPLLLEALQGSHRVAGSDPTFKLRVENMLGLLYTAERRYPQAEALLIDSSEGLRRSVGRDAPLTLLIKDNLASTYKAEHKYVDAELLYRQVLAARQHALGREHAQTLRTMYELADIYVEECKYDRAAALYKQTLVLQTHALGKEHMATLNTAHSLARLYFDQGRYGDAEQLCINALKICSSVFGPEDPATARNLGLMGELRLEQHRYVEAETLLRKALVVFRDRNIRNPLAQYAWESALGASLAGQKRDAEGESLLISAYENMRRLDSPPDASRFQFRRALERIIHFYRDRALREKAAEWQKFDGRGMVP